MTTTEERHLTWDSFRRDVIIPGVPAVHPVYGDPYVELFFEPGETRVGLRAACGDMVINLSADMIHLRPRVVERENRRLLEVSTDRSSLFRPLYALLVSTADLIQIEKVEPSEALKRAINSFLELVAESARPSAERARGLLGELWALKKMLRVRGAKAISAWIGPFGETHDFRVGDVEIEVKTTIQAQRIHSISSLEQLQPSPGAQLFVLSLHLVRAGEGSGFSVASLIHQIRQQISNEASAAQSFDRALHALEIAAFENALLEEAYKPRADARLSAVDERFPRITRQLLEKALAGSTARLRQATYSVDFADLGWPENSPEFGRIIGI